MECFAACLDDLCNTPHSHPHHHDCCCAMMRCHALQSWLHTSERVRHQIVGRISIGCLDMHIVSPLELNRGIGVPRDCCVWAVERRITLLIQFPHSRAWRLACKWFEGQCSATGQSKVWTPVQVVLCRKQPQQEWKRKRGLGREKMCQTKWRLSSFFPFFFLLSFPRFRIRLLLY